VRVWCLNSGEGSVCVVNDEVQSVLALLVL